MSLVAGAGGGTSFFREERETYCDSLGPVQKLFEQLLHLKLWWSSEISNGNNRYLHNTSPELSGIGNRIHHKQVNQTKEPSPRSYCLGSWCQQPCRKAAPSSTSEPERQLPFWKTVGFRDRGSLPLLPQEPDCSLAENSITDTSLPPSPAPCKPLHLRIQF